MEAIRSSEYDRMVKIELEAAEALAGLAHFPTNGSESHGSESIAERVKDESNDGYNSSFDTFPSNSYQGATLQKSEKLTAKPVKDFELRLNPTNYPTTGRKPRQNLTEAEMEARKIRRVLANRESARQTIRRRQAVFEELTRKAVDLAWENENLKREKDTASKHYDSLKTKNECLKAQMIKVNNIEAQETRQESITTNEPTISTSSTNSPFIIYNQPPFLPFVWPNSVQLQCGPPAGIVFPINKPDSSSCEEGSSTSPLYLLPYPWVVTLPQNTNDHHHHRPHSFNLNYKPKESPEFNQFFPEKVKSETPHATESNPKASTMQPSVSYEAIIDTNTFLKATTIGDSENIVGENIHQQPPVVCSGKRLGDMAAATEARKRRKELTKLKSHFQCRQLRMH